MDPELMIYYEKSRWDIFVWREKKQEAAVEEALAGGKCGVLIVYNLLGMMVVCEPNESVPYGYVYEKTDINL